MKLSQWAKQQGICYKTAWRMWKDGKLPVSASQLPTGTVILDVDTAVSQNVVIYARVSSHDQSKDLDRQVSRLVEYATKHGMAVSAVVKEIGSGLNGNRKQLSKLLADNKAAVIVVEHRDRLSRFGFEYIQSALHASGRKILVVDANEVKDDVVRDLHEIIVSMCSRLYGKRSAQNRAAKALEAINA